MQTPAPASRLRFVDAKQLDYRRLSTGALEVRNDVDETLGTFDGLIFDSATGWPHYIVVHAGGLAGNRNMIPVGRVRFDERARVLRIALDKDVAARYPSFDRHEFETLSEDALRGYQGRLLDFFKRDGETRSQGMAAEESHPDWLMTGVWMTIEPRDLR